MSRILIVDDEEKIARLLTDGIAGEGYDVSSCPSGEEAVSRVEKEEFDVVVCDLRLGGIDGLEVLRRVKRISPSTDVLIMTAYASAKTAVEAMKEGAYEYLVKPFDMAEVLLLLRRVEERRRLIAENAALRGRVAAETAADRLVGPSPAIARVRELIAMVAPTGSPVLVTGESGTGKELVAAAIHEQSPRGDRPMIIINCAAVPETLLEAELFGYEKGAFTGATQRKPGHFRLADGSTLFLDEIGDMPLALQAKLLRAIDNGEILPLGGSKRVRIDVRIVAATNRDLSKRAAEGTFREDLFYRLNVFPIHVSPLRERREDIIPIAEVFLAGWNRPPDALPPESRRALERYDWPGNVRELKNIIERAVILAGDGPVTPGHIATAPGGGAGPDEALRALIGKRTLGEIEERMIRFAIEAAGGNKSRAAEILGITRRTLYSRLERMEPPDRA
ncbi:MAG: sigma-54-dependent Fis family transcriptional regulator [Candidatus Krumholzibacteriota bacterium]|nr:sigma-54-dependent Fis family transcriptional regulator [Candidatus Krumholzibacteriota bacterium]